MYNTEELCTISADTVREACEQYLLSGNTKPFTDRLIEGAVALGLNIIEENGKYQILDQNYNTDLYSDELCMVSGNIALCNTGKKFAYRQDVNITALCKNTSDGIYFLNVHMSSYRKRLFNPEQTVSTDYYYRKLMDSLCDVFMEAKGDSTEFKFDKERYYNLFHEYPEFNNMDEWFWRICNNFVLEQDQEKLDLFRDSDIEKRIKNNDLIIDTSFRIRREPGETVWVNMKIVFIPDKFDETLSDIFVLLKDCTVEITEKMRNIKYARVDALTKIWNRRYTMELIEDKIYQDKRGIFVLFDVDKFKSINDIYGHITGDDILVKISGLISERITNDDVFGRLGGDEFVLYLKRSDDFEADKKRIEDIITATRFHHCEKDQGMDVHCSAGAVFFNNGRITFEELYQAADSVMYEAKAAGRDTVKIKEV